MSLSHTDHVVCSAAASQPCGGTLVLPPHQSSATNLDSSGRRQSWIDCTRQPHRAPVPEFRCVGDNARLLDAALPYSSHELGLGSVAINRAAAVRSHCSIAQVPFVQPQATKVQWRQIINQIGSFDVEL